MSVTRDREFFSRTFDFPIEAMEKLELYEKLLIRWQGMMNLVAPSTLDAIWTRHFADSAQILAHAKAPKVWADLGSGAGFPGMVCAILTADDTVFHLIESDARKCSFLRTVSRETGTPVQVHCGRIADVVPDLGDVDIVSARALAPLSQLIEMSHSMLENGALGLFLKGQDIASELTKVAINSRFAIDLVQSLTLEEGRIACVRRQLK